MRARLTLALLVFLAACAVNPATGRREFSLISEAREIEMGREADQQLAASLGLVDDPALAAYVSDLGLRLAAVSERPELPWTFRVLDDPAVNAFALPGGFIYVTRGILSQFDSEAELAGVLGHEIGHVTARHSVTQMSRQQLQQIGLGVGMVFSEDLRQVGSLAGAVLQMVNLSYSRGDESESDGLGLRYMSRTAYDGEALIGVFQMLASVSSGGGGRLPEWQLTHPYPENREAQIRAAIASGGGSGGGTVARDRYLGMLEGMIYGPDPRQGFFRGDRFLHPELAFQFTLPAGWQGVNQRDYVAGVSPEQDAVFMLALASDAGDPDSGLRTFLEQEGIEAGRASRGGTTAIPTASADFRAASEGGTLRGRVTFLSHGGLVYRLLGYTAEASWDVHGGGINAALDSFDRLTDRSVLEVQPWRMRIEPAPITLGLRELHRRWSVPIDVDEWGRLNRVGADDRIGAGTRLKRVVGRAFE